MKKKFVLITAAAVVLFALLRRFGPALRERAMTRCQEEFERISAKRTALSTDERTNGIAA